MWLCHFQDMAFEIAHIIINIFNLAEREKEKEQDKGLCL